MVTFFNFGGRYPPNPPKLVPAIISTLKGILKQTTHMGIPIILNPNGRAID